MLLKGTLLKGYSGFYYVYSEDRVWECSLRGRFRVKKQDFIPGDKVMILSDRGIKATIEEVLARENSLIRPNIANVDQALLVLAMSTPDTDFNLLDRLLVQVAHAGIEPVIVFTKYDLARESDLSPYEYYRTIGCRVFYVSNILAQGMEEVREIVRGRVSVLAGPSGAGKSSLLNSLEPSLKLKTGSVSDKLGRGKHTTRHVELLEAAKGLIADTPGFSSLYLPPMRKEQLQEYFPEFGPYRKECRFKDCLHVKEPGCALREAVQGGEMTGLRYEHYRQFLEEVKAAENKY
ncbi:ribosome biogenesis GTPase RsgA [Syntrophobotulus glycolicus DSM 8271]|uniref:Small ribosomal subunit biogenesis GTPase RsgA n=1 Tax=Syntrophobotulus glycolicus (strain DSM 8271 / FlGlyR) TaxID=645991 RepID=F0SUQ5_SYNGF|nr:ribosome small subunit-dependent GTPase A [Syntrophobotulus glycolicus]ADY56621.1 ribosome biogenesis GTPase RsgA [Syntrophobotulus glycolicus DSM 8271]